MGRVVVEGRGRGFDRLTRRLFCELRGWPSPRPSTSRVEIGEINWWPTVPRFARATLTGTTRTKRRMTGSFSSRATFRRSGNPRLLSLASACNSTRGVARHRTTRPLRFDALKCNPVIRVNANEVRRFGPPRGGENRRLFKASWPHSRRQPQSNALKCIGALGLDVDGVP